MVVWFLAFLGIAISFLVKYANRTDKKQSWSFTFWVKDNWPETASSVLMVIALVIIFNKSTFDAGPIIEKVPWITSLPMAEVAALMAGYLNNQLFYALFRTKKK